MLHDFLISNRSELIQRCRDKVAKRLAPLGTPAELEHGIPLFLDQLTQMLPGGANEGGGKEPSTKEGISFAEAQLEAGAALHGRDLRKHKFTIEQVVHDYGDLCQAITQLAAERDVEIPVGEFGMLNIKLDNAIATAVTEYSRGADDDAIGGISARNLADVVRQMRVQHAVMAVALAAMDRGLVGYAGATARALHDSSERLGKLIERAVDLTQSVA